MLTAKQAYHKAYSADYYRGIRRPPTHGVCECGKPWTSTKPNQRYCRQACKQVSAKVRALQGVTHG